MTLEQLLEMNTDTSVGVDGAASAIPVSQLRQNAVDAEHLPVVLGGKSKILDVGRAKRRFTPSQCVALLERDGGCAMCGAPPSHCEAHHIDWWDCDHGRTDLSNGVMLCVACHHTIHRDQWGAWDIKATNTHVWFVPPASVDPQRVPRLGGKARFGITDHDKQQLDTAAAAGPRLPAVAVVEPEPKPEPERGLGRKSGHEARRDPEREPGREPEREPGAEPAPAMLLL